MRVVVVVIRQEEGLTKRTKNANVHDGRHVPETVLGGRGRDDGRARAKDTSERARAGRQKRRRRRRRREEEDIEEEKK